jgi:glyoxylase-like metal-dependent hydrolase (beta-lactamase superfamily II)
MADSRLEHVSVHVDRFTADERTDRPVLGAVHGGERTLLVEGGASPAHLAAFLAELSRVGRPPVAAIVLTHWHWDHSFGSAAVEVPVVAHADTATQLAREAAYDWSDEALAQRVRDGLELEFCAEMIRLELPDRGDLRIVVPSITFDDRWEIDLGGVAAHAIHVGGDHAADSCAVHVVDDGVLFLGDCLYERLHAPERLLTLDGVRGVVRRVGALDARFVLEGHSNDVDDAWAHGARLAELEHAADLVERHGEEARAWAGDDENLRDLIAALLVGERLLDSP